MPYRIFSDQVSNRILLLFKIKDKMNFNTFLTFDSSLFNMFCDRKERIIR